ncbi:MAG TPA: SpoIIE family protein phosphatase [Nocardioidaceae bacterium]|jgi:PAS domain S-box-containing protein
MPTLLLVELSAGERAALAGSWPGGYDRVEARTDSLAQALTPDVAAVVVGAGAADPVRVVQEVHRDLPLVGVAVLAEPGTVGERRRAFTYAVDVPASLRLLGHDDPDLPGVVEELAEQSVRQRHHRTLLSAVSAPSARLEPHLVVPASLGALLDHAPFGVLVGDLEGELMSWNARAGRMFHLSTSASGRSIAGLFSDPAPVMQTFERARAGQLTEAEAGQVLEDPSGTAVEINAVPTRLEDGRDAVLVLIQDVTVRRQAEQVRDRLAGQLQLLAEVTESMAGTLDEDEALRRLVEVVVPTLADWVSVQLYDGRGMTRRVLMRHRDPANEPYTVLAGRRMPYSVSELSPSRRIARGESHVLLPEVGREQLAEMVPDAHTRDLLHRMDVRSVVAVPLPGRDGVLGSVVLVNTSRSTRFGDDDVAVALEVGRRAGIALQTAELYARQRELAMELQRSMLTEPPEPGHTEIEVRYVAAAQEAQVGGDWYDAFLQADGATVVAIGDVVGHDTRAAAAMGQVRGLLRGISYTTGAGPAETLRRLDEAMQALLGNTTATAFVARIERDPLVPGPSAARVSWSNAGHPPPALIPAGQPATLLRNDRADLLLGVMSDTARQERETLLECDATLVLYTDGLVERRGQSLDDGIELFLRTANRLGHLPLDRLCDQLLAELLPTEAEDDVALVAVRLHGDREAPGHGESPENGEPRSGHGG